MSLSWHAVWLIVVIIEPQSAKPHGRGALDQGDWQGFQPAGERIGPMLATLMISDRVARIGDIN